MTRQATKQPDLIFDVGMHQGEDTDFYLRKGFRVVAFEADPDLAQSCRERFAEELASGQLTVVEGAIIDDTSSPTITFYKNNDVTVWGTIDPNWKERNARAGWESVEITVAVVEFADCIERYGMPHYLKIDIEGADLVCLERLLQFDCAPDYVSIESDKLALSNIRQEMELLDKLGFNDFKLIQQATITQQRIPVPTKEGNDIEYEITHGSSGMFGADLPGDWVSLQTAMSAYRRIMLGYKVFGNDSFMRNNRLGRKVWQFLQQRLRRPIPGWFDTHARHSSLVD